MLSEKQKEYKREYTRKRRLDPEYRKREYAKNREYRKTHPEFMRRLHASHRERWKNDPAYKARQSANTRASYIRLRQKLFDAYGNKCACCGETERAFFELDHVNGGGTKEYQHYGEVQLYRHVIRSGFPQIYRILCANCNRGRQRNGGICPHQLKPV